MMTMQCCAEYAAKSAEGPSSLTEEERLAYDQMLKSIRAYTRYCEINYKKLVSKDLEENSDIDERELF